MSSSEAQARNRKNGRGRRVAACVAVLGALLAGCGSEAGFRPLYGPTSHGPAVNEKMARIQIATVPGRVGQRIRNELIFQSTGGGAPPPPAYSLEITITDSISSSLVLTTGDSLTQIYTLNASFRLISMRDKKIVLQGTSQGRAVFERFSSIYSNVRAREDAENRAAKTVSEEIKGRLAAFLASSSA